MVSDSASANIVSLNNVTRSIDMRHNATNNTLFLNVADYINLQSHAEGNIITGNHVGGHIKLSNKALGNNVTDNTARLVATTTSTTSTATSEHHHPHTFNSDTTTSTGNGPQHHQFTRSTTTTTTTTSSEHHNPHVHARGSITVSDSASDNLLARNNASDTNIEAVRARNNTAVGNNVTSILISNANDANFTGLSSGAISLNGGPG